MAVHYKYIKKIKDTGFSSTEATLLDGLTATAAELDILAVDGIDVTDKVTVDASAGGVAQTTNLTLVPAGSTIKEVVAVVSVAFNGNTTQTFEVGVTGNIDNYIDSVDFDPSATANTTYMSMTGGTNNDNKIPQPVATATQLIATWTNTAAMTAGSVDVYVTYTNLA